MSWGNKIIIAFILFATMIITLVVLCMRQDFDLVSDNYYEKELKFQDQIDATINAAPFDSAIHISVTAEEIVLAMPASGLKNFKEGEVLFYRASDSNLDVLQDLSFNAQGIQSFARDHFVMGNYRVKISWEADGKTFYHETSIHL